MAYLNFHLSTKGSVLQRYMNLDNNGKVQACYVWVDGSGESMRSKTKTLDFIAVTPEELPIIEIDGSSTKQATVGDSDVYLYPRCIFRDPFRPVGHNQLVLCDALDSEKKPVAGNHRQECLIQVMRTQEFKPWFGFEQEYVLIGKNGRPYGWPEEGYPRPQGPYYCSVGPENAILRDVSESLYRALLFSGVAVYGDNAEVLPSQWEYQVGTCEGITGADHLWMSRYILYRVAEDFGVSISLDPKPIPGLWNGSGCHTNVSTVETRRPGGINTMYTMIEKLKQAHEAHLKVYDLANGKDNVRRLTGSCETADCSKFSFGIGKRDASIRIPRLIGQAGCGYFEDRRPAANCDPYLVIARILQTIC